MLVGHVGLQEVLVAEFFVAKLTVSLNVEYLYLSTATGAGGKSLFQIRS